MEVSRTAVPLFEDLARGDNLEPEPTNGGFLYVPSFRKGHPSYPAEPVIGWEELLGGLTLAQRRGWISEQKLALLVDFAFCSCIFS